MQLHPYLDTPHPIAFAHRGGAGEWPENTIEAFSGSYDIGIRYMETDVHLTADGEVIAFHDPSLDRVSDVEGEISAHSWREISRIRVNGIGQIPRMKDLLDIFPDARFNIDMKSDDVVAPLLNLIVEQNAQYRVCLASFHDSRISRARQIAGPELCTSAGRIGVARTVMRGLGLPLSRCNNLILQVPLSRYGVPVLTERFIRQAHSDGKLVHVWTIDDENEMHRLLDLGVDGIISDRPARLKKVFSERGIWSA